MAITDQYRRQHSDLLNIAHQIAAELNPARLSNDATTVRSLLSTLAGKLSIHLAMEDKSLYPKLMQNSNPDVKATAKKFIDEMGGIAKAFDNYKNKWPHAMAIQKNPNDFISETKTLFNVLSKRIEKENKELYPLLERE
ncbi:MAG TPA: hemerythrin domain-containing protein [Caldithrix abyssi]|uniref:Hemerythrin domain-containing protein n=1 Tax=Caldithrix abyssi TaxID=187145 RepID=A0A7V4TZL5_CALAY|nr:hemerythrin domain-containing protein [Caldithrix abyssi]